MLKLIKTFMLATLSMFSFGGCAICATMPKEAKVVCKYKK